MSCEQFHASIFYCSKWNFWHIVKQTWCLKQKYFSLFQFQLIKYRLFFICWSWECDCYIFQRFQNVWSQMIKILEGYLFINCFLKLYFALFIILFAHWVLSIFLYYTFCSCPVVANVCISGFIVCQLFIACYGLLTLIFP